jgi:glycosyltransferase involved in cell wall biosynthesis
MTQVVSVGLANARPEPSRRLAILIVHSWYTSGPVSGVNRVVEDEVQLLRQYGHHVDCLTSEPIVATSADRIRAGAAAVWSRAGADRVRAAVASQRYDAVHFHNVYPEFSPAAFRVDVPVYVTLHSYRFTCIAGTLLRNGQICEDCVGRGPGRGVMHACFRGSRGASAAMAASLVVHRRAGTFRRVRRYFAVSRFQRQKHIDAGFPEDQVIVKPNFSWPQRQRSGSGEVYVFAGRIVDTKGVDVLLHAWKGLSHELLIIGDGPQLEWARSQSVPNVQFTGRLEPPAVAELIGKARAVLVPSQWYEGAPRTIIEAFAAGVPVIASRLGSLPELVTPGVSGVLVDRQDVEGWRAAVESLADDDCSARLGEGARREWMSHYSPDRAIANLEAAYTSP